VELPINPYYGYYGYWGWYGFYFYDWYDGDSIVMVGDHTLAFRRWVGYTAYDDAANALYVVDLSNADSPSLASTTITHDTTAWWGNLRAIGNTLCATHYEWYTVTTPIAQDGGAAAGENTSSGGSSSSNDGTSTGGTGSDSAGNTGSTTLTNTYVKYYLDRIDLTDPAHPQVGSKVNVPGVLVGAKSDDPSILYTVRYYWDDGAYQQHDALSVVKLEGDKARLLSSVHLDGWVGKVIVQDDKAYMSVQTNGTNDAGQYTSTIQLHEIDFSDPTHPVDLPATARDGWGWLLEVSGDRVFVTSGWGDAGFDVYKLAPSGPPVFDQFVRTRGWGTSSIKRQGNSAYFATGYWGVQAVQLQ